MDIQLHEKNQNLPQLLEPAGTYSRSGEAFQFSLLDDDSEGKT